MISPEVLRRFPICGNLDLQQIEVLAGHADELQVEADHYFFHEDDDLEACFLLLEGQVAILLETTDKERSKSVAGQLTGEVATTSTVVSKLVPGEIFGWSGMIPPHIATASAKTVSPSRVARFDSAKLRQAIEADPKFGMVMMQKMAEVIRDRLKNLRVETLAFMHESA